MKKNNTIKRTPQKPTVYEIESKKRVAHALSELLCNPETPTQLFERLADFVCEATGGDSDGLQRAVYWRPEVLGKLIEYIDDPVGIRLGPVAEERKAHRRISGGE